MSNKWDRRFLEVAQLVSNWSKDPSTKVGCILVKDRKIVATGYNGFPEKIADDDRLNVREQKYRLVVHAEMNALLQAGHDANGATLYQYGFVGGWCCDNCTKHAIQAGVVRAVCQEGEVNQRWADELAASAETFREAGVVLDAIPLND